VGLLTHALVGAGPQAIKACKKLLHDVAGHEITAGLVRRTVEGIADIRASDEGREGIQSFLGKRKPGWLSGS
jgi:methylglutaconyl-CoA hydratase